MVLEEDRHFKMVQIAALNELPKEGQWAVLTSDRTDETQLKELCSKMGSDLAVQEIWKELLPEASLLISSAICGGDIQTRFHEAAVGRTCYLLLEPIRMRFPLPCLDGCGTDIHEFSQEPHFYSDALCCYYAHTPDAIILWDTEETLAQKIRLAKEAGFSGVACK